jgi:hypothetical protein
MVSFSSLHDDERPDEVLHQFHSIDLVIPLQMVVLMVDFGLHPLRTTHNTCRRHREVSDGRNPPCAAATEEVRYRGGAQSAVVRIGIDENNQRSLKFRRV